MCSTLLKYVIAARLQTWHLPLKIWTFAVIVVPTAAVPCWWLVTNISNKLTITELFFFFFFTSCMRTWSFLLNKIIQITKHVDTPYLTDLHTLVTQTSVYRKTWFTLPLIHQNNSFFFNFVDKDVTCALHKMDLIIKLLYLFLKAWPCRDPLSQTCKTNVLVELC